MPVCVKRRKPLSDSQALNALEDSEASSDDGETSQFSDDEEDEDNRSPCSKKRRIVEPDDSAVDLFNLTPDAGEQSSQRLTSTLAS